MLDSDSNVWLHKDKIDSVKHRSSSGSLVTRVVDFDDTSLVV